LKELLKLPEVDLFWVLNPDSVPAPDAAKLFIARAEGKEFSLMGGPTVYYEFPDLLQSYGGRVGRWSGTCRNIGQGLPVSVAQAPDPSTVDFVSGANMIASRRFIEKVGLLTEDYFLYYEEVDWAFQRGELPLIIASEPRVYHHGGTTIGTGSTTRRASPFANYFNFRNRVIFAKRHLRVWTGFVYLYALAKAAVLFVKGAFAESWAIVCGVFRLKPAPAIVSRLSDPEAQRRAFQMRFE
jgi:GT2 family glycosyltransferase